MGEILAAIIVFIVLIGIAYLLPSSHRRHECYTPVDDHAKPGAHIAHSWDCDICRVHHSCKTLNLKLERRDFNLFNVMIYKRSTHVQLCDECYKSVDSRAWRPYWILAFALAVGVLSAAVAVFAFDYTVAQAKYVAILWSVFGTLAGIPISHFVYRKRKSLMDTWQMKDLAKDNWRVVSYETL